jgi:hypothetical protein
MSGLTALFFLYLLSKGGKGGSKTIPERWTMPGGWVQEFPAEQAPETRSRANDMLQLLEPGTFKDETVYTGGYPGMLTRRFYLYPDKSQVVVYKQKQEEPVVRGLYARR